MRDPLKRLIALVLCLALMICLVPPVAGADEAEEELETFTDVAQTDWFYASVYYVYGRGLMLGTGNGRFSPSVTTNRAMLVTILYRMEREPEALPGSFSDVPPGRWYSDAVNWAAANNIVNGVGGNLFQPTGTLTREQFAVILYRYAAFMGLDVTAEQDLSAFEDADRISAFARKAMEWAVAKGLMNGVTKTRIDPRGSATRAQTAALLMRFEKNILTEVTDLEADFDYTAPLAWSTEAPADEALILEADTQQVTVLEPVTVNFTLETSLVVPEFHLWRDGVDTGYELVDDYQESDTRDGCYTCAYPFTPADSTEDIVFTAVASVGDAVVFSEECILEPWRPITEAQYARLETLWSGFEAIFTAVENDAGPDADPEDVARITKNQVLVYLREQRAKGNIEDFSNNFSVDPTGIASEEDYTVSYTAFGTEFGVCCLDPAAPDTALTAEQEAELEKEPEPGWDEDLDEDPGIEYDDGPAKKYGGGDYDASGKYANALILCYDHKNSGGWHEYYANKIKVQLINSGFKVDVRYGFSADDLRAMTGYDYIYIKAHGGMYCSYPCILTGQNVNYNVLNHYGKDMRKRRVVAVYTKARGNRIWAYPKLFTDWYSGIRNLDANLVSVSCCRGGYNRKLATALMRSGADAVTVYDEKVYTAYDYYMTSCELEQLMKGKTIAQAVAAAKKRYGKTDQVWAKKNNIHNKTETADQRIWGRYYDTLYPELVNWSFLKWDSKGNWHTTLDYWRKYGKAKAVTRQGTIVARNNFMAKISTQGRGEYGSSYIYQTFLVPEDVDTLKFDYAVLTTESQSKAHGNDYFQAELLDQYGKVMDVIAFESVSSATWYYTNTTGFCGDQWVGFTHWKQCVFNRMDEYAGQVVTLRFRVKDRGYENKYTGALISCIWLD